MASAAESAPGNPPAELLLNFRAQSSARLTGATIEGIVADPTEATIPINLDNPANYVKAQCFSPPEVNSISYDANGAAGAIAGSITATSTLSHQLQFAVKIAW